MSDANEDNIWTQRQRQLPEIGEGGQKCLSESRIAVVGAGGLGCPVLWALAGANVGELSLFDGDCVEKSNLHRQNLFQWQDLGSSKVSAAKRTLENYNPFVKINTFRFCLHERNAEESLKGHDLIVDATDDWATKFLLHDISRFLGIPLIQGAVYQWEGEIQVFTHDKEVPCLHCLWEKSPSASCLGNCQEAGVLGVVPQIMGHFQALEAIKLLTQGESSLQGKKMLFNFHSLETLTLGLRKKEDCKFCSMELQRERLLEAHRERLKTYEWELVASEYDPETLEHLQWVDIRESHERNPHHPLEKKMIHRPRSSWRPHSLDEFDGPVLVICEKGGRSRDFVMQIKNSGSSREVYSLAGGLSLWKELMQETD